MYVEWLSRCIEDPVKAMGIRWMRDAQEAMSNVSTWKRPVSSSGRLLAAFMMMMNSVFEIDLGLQLVYFVSSVGT